MKNDKFNGALLLLFVLVGVATDHIGLWMAIGVVPAGGSAAAGRVRERGKR